MSKKTIAMLLVLLFAFLAADGGAAPTAATAARVKRIEPYDGQPAASTGGAIAGAVVGGVLGNQVGGGDGKKVATVAGAVGGAYAGKKIAENSARTR